MPQTSIYWLPAILVIVANAGFHLVQKSIAPGAHPLVSVMVTYLVGFTSCVVLLQFFPLRGTMIEEIARLNWASAALGLTIVGIEIGYLLMYRNGWNVSIGFVFTYSASMLLLVPLGLILFAERLSWHNLLGIGING